ncbi:MAG: ATP-binding cassette domain-containing protein [Eubacteriales bacterium]|nr:ATP-binding cassette domain-containing protein [Eubacteriales bacterium]
MLQVENLHKDYYGDVVFENVSFTLPDTGLFVIRGENGSGKSTLLSLLAGIDEEYSGRILFDGDEITDKNRNTYREEKVSCLTQDPIVFEEETVLRNVLLPFDHADIKKAKEVLKELSLDELKKSLGRNLSGGEKERVALARILYQPKDIILLDEVTSQLDKESQSLVIKAIAKLSLTHLVLFVTHEEFEEPSISSAGTLQVANHGVLLRNAPETEGTHRKNKASLPSTSAVRDAKNAFHANRWLYLLCFLFSVVFSALAVLSGSLKSTFLTQSIGQSQLDNSDNIRKEIFLSNAPILIVDSATEGYQGDSLLCADYEWSDRINKNSSEETDGAGSRFSGIYCFDANLNLAKDSFCYTEMIAGTYPVNDGEAILSDLFQSVYNVGDTYSTHNGFGLSPEYKIVGFYRSKKLDDLDARYAKEREVQKELQAKSDGRLVTLSENRYIRSTYSFLQESIFVIDTKASHNFHAVPNTEENRAVYRKNEFQTGLLHVSDADFSAVYSPISVDARGKEVLAPLIHRQYHPWIFLLILGVFDFVFLAGFSIRKRRKYLLLRLTGTRRERLTSANVLVFSITSFLSLLVGVAVGYLLVWRCGMGILRNSYQFMSFDGFSVLYLALLSVLSVLVFTLLLYCYLAPRDLTEERKEAMGK